MRTFECFRCGDHANCPMLKEEVWEKIGIKRTLVCFDCAEGLLERQLTFKDLKNCPGNSPFIILATRKGYNND